MSLIDTVPRLLILPDSLTIMSEIVMILDRLHLCLREMIVARDMILTLDHSRLRVTMVAVGWGQAMVGALLIGESSA